jgi:hypothetical protein
MLEESAPGSRDSLGAEPTHVTFSSGQDRYFYALRQARDARVSYTPWVSRLRSALLLALVTSVFAACVQRPTVRLNHAEISGVQLGSLPANLSLANLGLVNLGLVMTVVLDVYNPNGYDVAVRGVRGQAVLADQYPLAVLFRAPPDGIWMPAGQTTPVRVPITVPLQLALVLARETLASPTIPYRFTGAADVTASRTFQLEKDNYTFDEHGAITRAQMLAVIPDTLLSR